MASSDLCLHCAAPLTTGSAKRRGTCALCHVKRSPLPPYIMPTGANAEAVNLLGPDERPATQSPSDFRCSHGYTQDNWQDCAECRDLSQRVERGMSSAEAFAEYHKPFDDALTRRIAESGVSWAEAMANAALVAKMLAPGEPSYTVEQGTEPGTMAMRVSTPVYATEAGKQYLSRLAGQMTKERPNWHAYYLAIANDVAARVTCPAGRVGCVIVSLEGVPVMFGYNGAPAGVTHCDEAGCSWVERISTQGEQRSYARHVHAEANAIARAARVGARLDRSSLYGTQEPCPECLKLCLQAGIREIVVGSVKDRKWFEQAASICEDAGVLWGEAQG